MTKQIEIEQRIEMMQDVCEIINAMKNLAYMDFLKISRLEKTQAEMIKLMEGAAADLIYFHSDLKLEMPLPKLFILIGSERGFCGGFNHILLKKFNRYIKENAIQSPLLVSIGAKFNSISEWDTLQSINGPAVAQEVDQVVSKLVQTVYEILKTHGELNVTVVYHNSKSEIVFKSILPPFQSLDLRIASSTPPQINLKPKILLQKLSEQYLYAVLHEIFFKSLKAEYQQRTEHLDTAVNRFQDNIDSLNLTKKMLRQEEITEEIEVILLSSEFQESETGL